jgi:hypothetical protein
MSDKPKMIDREAAAAMHKESLEFFEHFVDTESFAKVKERINAIRDEPIFIEDQRIYEIKMNRRSRRTNIWHLVEVGSSDTRPAVCGAKPGRGGWTWRAGPDVTCHKCQKLLKGA